MIPDRNLPPRSGRPRAAGITGLAARAEPDAFRRRGTSFHADLRDAFAIPAAANDPLPYGDDEFYPEWVSFGRAESLALVPPRGGLNGE